MQGIFISNSGDQAHSMSGNGIEAFFLYMLWHAIFFNVSVIELSYSLFIMLNITEEKNALCCLVFVNINSSFSGKERDHKGFLMACRGVCCYLGHLGGKE